MFKFLLLHTELCVGLFDNFDKVKSLARITCPSTLLVIILNGLLAATLRCECISDRCDEHSDGGEENAEEDAVDDLTKEVFYRMVPTAHSY